MSKLALCLLLVAASVAQGRSHHRKSEAGSRDVASVDFAYYLLSLSWAPDFCAQPDVRKDPRECGAGRRVGFVVHGLWPQGDNSRGPEHCGQARPVGQDLVRVMLNYIPSEGLIQHEWTNHGTCSGLSAADYFAAVRKARDSVKIPARFTAPGSELNLSAAEIEREFASANPNFPRGAFRVSCHGSELQEVRICFNRDLTPRACTDSAGECRVPSILVRPVR